ncbi:MAG: hypothetical protein Q8P52_02370 [bacterium]|nr:hypothetical protein [bacterium]
MNDSSIEVERTLTKIKTLPLFKAEERKWGLEPLIFLLIGFVLLAYEGSAHSLDVVSETIILVVFLAGLMGVTRSIGIPLGIPLSAIPVVCGFGSMFMDSFLILLLISRTNFEGEILEVLKFKTYCTIAALVGGIGTYFGEVYMLPLCLKYGMREWWCMLPFWPPIAILLSVLAFLCSRLKIVLAATPLVRENGGGAHGAARLSWQDIGEFCFFIALLLYTKNPILCILSLTLWSCFSGQGDDLIKGVWDVDRAVLGLLVFALLLVHAPAFVLTDWTLALFSKSEGWYVFIPAFANSVLAGALLSATGDFWTEALILSTAVQFMPFSSLVGLMVFKPKEWLSYFKTAFPLMVFWFVLCGTYLFFIWKPFLEEPFYSVFEKRPALVEAAELH